MKAAPSVKAAPSALDFDANSLALQPGVQLLEASAGTGKTFALAHLVLRLVSRELDPLDLERLLVVTFTDAAAAELRDRIARRLQQALAAVEGSGPPADQVLADWLALQPEDLEQRLRLQGRLLLALEGLDRADITTIHGFCHRTLQRHALEAGLGPTPELDSDDGERSAQVVHDYWQRQVLSLDPAMLAGLSQQGVTPELLQRLLRRLDADPALQLEPLPPDLLADQPLAPQLQAIWQRRWHDFVAQWEAGGAGLEQACRDLATELRSWGVKDTKPYSPAPRTDRCAQLNAWLEGLRASLGDAPASYDLVLGQPLLQSYFHPAVFTKLAEGPLADGPTNQAPPDSAKPASKRSLPQRALQEAIAAIVDGPVELLLAHGLHWSREELQRRRSSSGKLSFGDLLACLDPGPKVSGQEESSCHRQSSGHQEDSSQVEVSGHEEGSGQAKNSGRAESSVNAKTSGHGDLIAAVSARYQVALVDEFQDTDPIQWRILERAFTLPKAEGPQHLLVMVGDPKQAIYRFRGGELATYRRASQRADAIYSLRENRRASPGLVAALNALMAPGLVGSRLAVPEVLARADHGQLLLDPGESPLQLLPLESDEQLPDQVAGLCLRLLQRPLRIRNGNDLDGWRERPLTPADICLLVAKHRQAEELRTALERRQLPSRLVSRGDVFASEAAAALQRLLDALADPGNPGRQRLLAVSPLLGWTAETLAAAGPDHWDRLGDQLAGLASRLPRDGLLACLGQLLRTEGLARLSLGGRLLADLQQAAELVQERMHQLGQGAGAAADWLRRRRLDPDPEVPEAHQLNSTAADAAIAVVTVHRSKGLEYPVVICPYLWRASERPSAAIRELGRRWLPPGADGPLLDLHRSPHWGRGRAAAEENWLAQRQEAERLAYVAATRAQHLLVLGWRQGQARQNSAGKNRASQDNPLAGWLLQSDGERRSPEELPITEINPEDLPAAAARWQPAAGEGELRLGPLPRQRLDSSWGRSSYTSWTHGGPLQPGAVEEGRQGDEPAANPLAPEQPGALGDSEEIKSASPSASNAATKSASQLASQSARASASNDEPGFADPLGPLASFPRGSGPGEALHRILERLDYGQSPNEPQARAVIEQELARAALDTGWAEALSEGLAQLWLTPMGAGLGGFRLAELAREERLNELNFDLPLAVPKPRLTATNAPGTSIGTGTSTGRAGWPLVRARGLADCFRRHPGGLFGEAYADDLDRLELASRGFLTGSIDLVFRRGERWWVLDWKSNWLGERDAAGSPKACGPAHYGQAAMAQLMAACHYPLQAHLYLVALHRYLRWRLPGYRPDLHLGGYAYVFLRGVPGHSPSIQRWAARGEAIPGMLVEQPPLARLLALDSLLREGLA